MIGSIVSIANSVAPDGTLLCDGSSHLRADYPRLYDALDTLYHVDANNFTVPDLRARFVIGTGTDGVLTNRVLGASGGDETITLDVSQMPSHSHTNIPHSHGYTQPTFGIDIESVGIPDPTGVGNPPVPQITTSESIAIDSTGGDQPHDNIPPFVVLTYVIVAR